MITVPQVGVPGVAAPTNATQVGGTDGSIFRAISVDTNGRINVNINGTVLVSGTVAVSAIPALPTGANVIGHVIVDTLPAAAATAANQAAMLGTAILTVSAGQKAMSSSIPVVLASDQTPLGVSPVGSTKAAAGLLFEASTGLVALSALSTITPVLLISNPTGSTKSLYLERIQIGTAASSSYTILRNPTVTSNGTALSLLNRKSGSLVSGFTSKAYSSPVFTGGAVERAGFCVGNSEVEIKLDGGLILDPGDRIVITATSNVTLTGLFNVNASASFVAWEA